MPKAGHKSLSVTDKLYDKVYETYQNKKSEGLLEPGITSFAGYFTHIIQSKHDEQKALVKLANKIDTDKIPEKFLTTKTFINTSSGIIKWTHTPIH